MAVADAVPLTHSAGCAIAFEAFPNLLDSAFLSFMLTTEDCVHIIDARGSVVWANPSARAAVDGWDLVNAGWRWGRAWPSEHRQTALAAVRASLRSGTARFTGHTMGKGGKERRWNVALTRIAVLESSDFVIAIAREIAPRTTYPENVRARDGLDSLTGLPDGVSFHQELSRRTADRNARAEPFGLAIIDLDGFKQLNHRLGSQVCDAVLARFASLVAEAAGESCFVARSGGDELALIFDNSAGIAGLAERVARLIQQCTNEISIGDNSEELTASAGTSLFPADATTDQDLIRNAHTALRAAKTAGRGKCVNFDGGMRQQLQRHSSMLEVARVAIAGDWMRPYYQPKIDLTSGKVVGLEALLRWKSVDGVVHFPSSIAAALDDPEIATHISDLMLRKVIVDVTSWRRTGSDLPVAINVSSADFRDARFADRFLSELARASLPPELFEVEVTERVFLGAGAADVGDALRRLSRAGVRIALDDFGTGYASLSHLKQHPVDVIKIDRSFVSNLVACPEDRAIVGAMVSLSRRLAIEVVAEGVETTGQATLLRDLGCQTGQGFLFSRAVPGHEIPNIARNHSI